MITAQKLRPDTRFSVSGKSGVYLKSHDVGNITFAKTIFGDSPEEAGKIVEIDGNSPCYIISSGNTKKPFKSPKQNNVGQSDGKTAKKPKPPSEYIVLSVINEDKGELMRIEHVTALKLTAFSSADSIRISDGPNQGEYDVNRTAFDSDENHFYVVVG